MIDPIRQSAHLDPSVVADLRALGSATEDVLGEVIGLFLGDVPLQLSALTVALEAADGEATWQVAHRLKGSALGMGAWRMAQICAAVEAAARARAFDGIPARLTELVAEFESTRAALEEEVSA